MAFEQNLRAYLEWQDGASPADVPLRHIDEHELHRHLLGRLCALEHAGGTVTVKRLFDEWQRKLPTLARYLEMLPSQLAPVDLQDALQFACRVLDAATDCLDPDVALVERLELERLVRLFDGFDRGGFAQLESYALENHLVRRDHPHPARLTELGRVFLRLRGKDAVRRLVTVEVAQSTGPRDPWHASHDLLRATMDDELQMDATQGFGYAQQTLDRLDNLGMLTAITADSGGFTYAYRLSAAMRDVVRAVLEPGPWHTAVRALLDDERALALPGSSPSAAEATIEQTKLIVHEVRNALIPVRHDIEALRSFAAEHAEQHRIDTAKQGIARVLEFVEDMAQTSELITEPAVRCEIGSVIGEALGWIDVTRRVDRVSSPEALHVLAPRIRLAHAIKDVVRNALQATTAGQPVRLSIWCEDSDLGGARFVIELPLTSPE